MSNLSSTDTDQNYKGESRILRSVSLFFRDDAINSDKEYHAQLIQFGDSQTAKEAFNVSYQYGKRGSNLTTGNLFEHPVYHYAASNGYNDLVGSKTKKGYRCVEMGSLDAVYKRMTLLGLDEAGVDLFMSARAKVISLADYIRKHQAPSRAGEFGFVDSYNASRAFSAVLSETGMGKTDQDGRKIQKNIESISKMKEFIEISNLNIFLGRQDGAVVEPCFEADRYMLMQDPEKAEKAQTKKKSPRP